jgi:tryptophanyl-tRNA synthetase
MSKSSDSDAGLIYLRDDPSAIVRKFKRAVTDSDGEVRYDPVEKPGVSNLLSILAAATGRRAEDVAAEYSQYGPLKADCGEAVVELVAPIQARFAELAADPGETSRLLGLGAAKASAVAVPVLDRARTAIGLTPR